MLGKTEISEFSPLQYLINNLDSAAYKGEAFPFLVELARDAQVRQALYPPWLPAPRTKRSAWPACWRAAATRRASRHCRS